VAVHRVRDVVKRVYSVLETLGYKPVVVGTYALILQGWLPEDYFMETKDIDIYVGEPMIVFDDRIEESIYSLGLSLGRSEAGGIYIDSDKPIEIVYPLHEFYIPPRLLERVVIIDDMRILEGHAVLVAKALGGNIDQLAEAISVKPDPLTLSVLLENIAGYVSREIYMLAKKRVERFIELLGNRYSVGGVVLAG
jgi:predicted nucleotidyltransferase